MRTIFITGASGCVGSYVVDALLRREDVQLHLLSRHPDKLPERWRSEPRVTVHLGTMETIETCKSILSQSEILIHIATAWGDGPDSFITNVEKTNEMISYLDPAIFSRMIYFSTASLLNKHHEIVAEAEYSGTAYIRSKYGCYRMLEASPIWNRVVTIFPTIILGGDSTHALTHVSQGFKEKLPYLNLIRWLNIDGAFHFIHAADIAQCIAAIAELKDPKSHYVLGQAALTVKAAIQTICRVYQKKIWFQWTIPLQGLLPLAGILGIKLSNWDRYCMTHPEMIYSVSNPETFGLKSAFPTAESAILAVRSS